MVSWTEWRLTGMRLYRQYISSFQFHEAGPIYRRSTSNDHTLVLRYGHCKSLPAHRSAPVSQILLQFGISSRIFLNCHVKGLLFFHSSGETIGAEFALRSPDGASKVNLTKRVSFSFVPRQLGSSVNSMSLETLDFLGPIFSGMT